MATFTVGGTVSGLSSVPLVLRMGTVTLVVTSNKTTFTFGTGLAAGKSYSVLVALQPPGYQCTISNGVGTISSSNVTNVAVSCARTYTISGSISGLTAPGLTLKLNGVSKLVTAGSTSFTFATALKSASIYAVTVGTQPAGQTCTVVNGSGTIVDTNISNVTLTCMTAGSSSSSSVASSLSSSTASSSASSSSSSAPVSYTVAVNVSGHTGAVTVTNNGENKSVTVGSTSAVFSPQANGTAFSVGWTNPAGQTCNAFNNSGTISGANVTVSLICITNSYTVGGAITGLSGAGLSLSLSGTKTDTVIPVSGSTSYVFTSTLVTGNTYTVDIVTQPTGQICSISNQTGTIGSTDASNANVICTTSSVSSASSAVSSISSVSSSAASSTSSTCTNTSNSCYQPPIAANVIALVGSTSGNLIWQVKGTKGGGLSPSPSSSIQADTSPTAIAITPNNLYAYAVNSSVSTISLFNIAADGTLSAQNNPAISTGYQSVPVDVAVDPTGKYVYVVNNATNTVAQYLINSTGLTAGTLTPMSIPTVATGASPKAIDIVADLTGTYAYVVGGTSISQFKIGTDGALISLATPITAGSDLQDVALYPYYPTVGNPITYAFITSKGTNSVLQYIVSSDGTLTANTKSSSQTGSGPMGISVAPDGKYVFVANNLDNSIWAYTVKSGSLTEAVDNTTTGVGRLTTSVFGPTKVAVMIAYDNSIPAKPLAYVVGANSNGTLVIANYRTASATSFSYGSIGTITISGTNPAGIALGQLPPK